MRLAITWNPRSLDIGGFFGKEGAGADEAPANEGETEVKDLGKANEKRRRKRKKQAEEPMKEAV